VEKRADQLGRGGGAVGEHHHVSSHEAAPFFRM
jgi:hypothetical protein